MEIRKTKLGTVHYFTNKSRLALAKLYKELNRDNEFQIIFTEMLNNCKGDNIENVALIENLKELNKD